jgi:hypothetical protein
MIKDKRPSIAILHFDHKVWGNQLNFYETELKILGEKLEEIASKNTSKEMRVSIEQFQNKFIIQNNEIDILNHKIKLNEHQISIPRTKGPYLTPPEAANNYVRIKDEIEQFIKIYSEVKEDFFKFLSKWM